MVLENVLNVVAAGLIVGCLYGLMCIGLGLIFGIMKVVNFAQGELLMLGMYVSFYLVGGFAAAHVLGPYAAPFVAALTGSAILMRNEKMPMREAAYEWRRFYEEADAIVRRLDPGQWRQVRYEELCAEPEQTLGALWDFLGMPREVPEGARKELHVLGHDTRLNMGRARPNEKWRTELSAADLQVFEATAGRLNRQLGYS